MLPQPLESPGGCNGVEVGRTRHHVAERDHDAPQTGPEGKEIHAYCHAVAVGGAERRGLTLFWLGVEWSATS